jgi:putative PEP-CTERM system histidine kinase
MGALWISLVIGLYATALGALAVRRAPRHPSHISFGIGMILLAADVALGALSVEELAGIDALTWQRWRVTIAALLPVPWLIFSRCYSRGDGLEVIAGRTWWILGAALLPVIYAGTFYDSLVIRSTNPFLHGDELRLGAAGLIIQVLLLLTSVIVVTHLERTFLGSVGVMRWRLKYMVLGVGVLFGHRLYVTSQSILYQMPEEAIGRGGAAALLVGCVLISVALARGSVFDVDVYPSHRFIYGSLTVLLAGAYLIIVGLLSQLLSYLGGPTAFPLQSLLILIALSGLGVMLFSERLRQQIRQFISRHLRRPGYDYRHVWSTFTRRTTSVLDEQTFCRTVANWLSETFQALSATIWVVEESGDRLKMAGSTSLGNAEAEELNPPREAVREALAAIGDLDVPVVLDPSRLPWATTLQRLHPVAFDSGRNVCQPLRAGGKLVGLVILGDRVAALPFTTEDFDLLKCMADQVASNLVGLQLSAQLLRAKEMEAFQTMSAFFVHDLKNTASTLSLTLQNLNQHFSDPAFRQDALRAVRRSVEHLNNLIARLTRLRQELRICPVPGNLGEIIDSALTTLGPTPSLRIQKQLEPLPPVSIDAEQIEKVVVNLLVNARDAVGQDGAILVRAYRENGWATLMVKDNGCGMSPEFLRGALFRPFQTTKKTGLGIGMFHSRMIVEAHRGRMEVDSQMGHGTTVRVLLPLAKHA